MSKKIAFTSVNFLVISTYTLAENQCSQAKRGIIGSVKLTYQTGTGTVIQFIVLSLLNIVNGIVSIVTTCTHPGGDCTGNILSSIIFYILIVSWFGVVLILGYLAQQKRSRRLAQALIAAEGAIMLVALFNIKLTLKYHNGFLNLFTSTVDLVLALWIVTLAYRLMRAGGGRVVRRERIRKRPTSSQSPE